MNFISNMETNKIREIQKAIISLKRKIGIKQMFRGLSYYRSLEYPLVVQRLDLKRKLKILDIGSGTSVFPLFLAKLGCVAYATDINDEVFHLEGFAQKLGITTLFVEKQDVRELSYPNEFFDRVTAISTIEHIPHKGDIRAMQEIARVLCKGGRAIITVPYGNDYQEYERKLFPHVHYFERSYDNDAIIDRLIKPSGLEVKYLEYFGERGFNFGRYWDRIPFFIRYFSSLLQPTFSNVFLSRVEDPTFAGGVCITLQRNL